MKTILVLEEELPILKLLRHMKQYGVVGASIADEALLLSIDLNYQVDLLVADLTMPIRSGIQVALLLRAKIPDLPGIITSGYPVSNWSERDSADLQRLGPLSLVILQKPFGAKVLSNAVRELLGESHAGRGCENGLIRQDLCFLALNEMEGSLK